MMRCSPAVLAQALARDLDRDLDQARAQDLDQDLERDLAGVLDSADVLAQVLTNAHAHADPLAFVQARALVHTLASALIRARNLACARPRARNLVRALTRALNRARVLDRSLHVEMWSAGGAGSMPSRVPCGLVEVVVRMLPEHDRQRTREELCSELVEMSRREQHQYALRVLTRAWQLRRELVTMVRTPDGAAAHRVKR